MAIHKILGTNHKNSYSQEGFLGFIDFSFKFIFSKDLIRLVFPDKDSVFKTHKFSYKFSDVTNFKEIDEEVIEINKTAGGTIGGAVIGTLVAGPFGTIVGGMAGGNKKKDKKKSSTFAIEFNNDEWVTFKIKNNVNGKLEIAAFKGSFTEFFKDEEELEENPFKADE